MFTRLGLVSLYVVLALPQASWGEAACFAKDAVNGKETVTQELHPAGPTTRREWRNGEADQPHRIQYENIRSGHVLVGKAKLIRDKSGVWYVESSCKKRLRLLGRNERKAQKVRTIIEEDQIWRICVTRQVIPPAQQGVATEGEPSLDVVLVRR